MKTFLTILILVIALVPESVAQKRNQAKIPKLDVIDRPKIDWGNYSADTTEVATNIQIMHAIIRSRVPLLRIEVKLNGITTSVYEAADFSKPVAENQYEEHIEPSLTLRNGLNSIVIIATNEKAVKVESARRVIVDPTKITALRNEKDRNAPMIYVSEPANIKDERVIVYQDAISMKGTVIDESGIQSLKINGIVVPVKENGAYTIFLPLNVGENHVNMEVKDINQNIALKKFVIDRKNADGTEYSSEDAKNYLLMVGINSYEHWNPLNNAVSDVMKVKKILTEKYRFDEENVTVLTDAEATRSGIYSTLRTFIEKITPRDNLLIYYSGHGYFDKLLNEGYWVPVEAADGDASTYIPNSQILKIIENINSQHTFLIADACFSGSLFASSTRGYSENVEKFKSRWGLASGRLEFVTDGSIGTNSPFAQGVVEFLENSNDNKVPVSDLIQYVKKKVAEVTDQTPIGNPLKGVGDEGGEFVFYKRK